LPDLSSKSLSENELFGIILTMVTSTKNPSNKTFVHVNGIKYRTNDAIEMGNGSIFIPITKSDMQKSEKSYVTIDDNDIFKYSKPLFQISSSVHHLQKI